MEQSDTDQVWGTWAAVLLDGWWAVCRLLLIKEPLQMSEGTMTSMAPQLWGYRVLTLMEWSLGHL